MRSCFDAAQVSNPGGRDYNEDHTLTAATHDTACWVVADGLGGHGGGADASAIACQAVIASFLANPSPSPGAVQSHIRSAHQSVLAQQVAQPALARMRTTIVVLVANAVHAVWGHVGDSRLYHLRRGKILAQTKDHSVPQNLVEAGEITSEQIRHHEDRNRLLRSLGEEEVARASILPEAIPVCQGDAFLLCSDGFWEKVHELEMELDFAKSREPAEWLSYMETRLQERVDGSHDNYTAVAIIGDGLPVTCSALPAAIGADSTVPRTAWKHRLLRLTVFLFVPIALLAGAIYLASGEWMGRKPLLQYFSLPKAAAPAKSQPGSSAKPTEDPAPGVTGEKP